MAIRRQTRGRFMRKVLADLGVTRRKVGIRHLRDCVTVLLGQSLGESGREPCNGKAGQGARYNPLNTTYDLRPNSDYNSAHVKNYASFRQGINATADTFRLPYYTDVRALFMNKSATPHAMAGALATSPWGTGQLAVTCTDQLVANPTERRQIRNLTVGV